MPVPPPLYVLDPPESLGPAWAPFAGVRPIGELRAGIWRIRERWERALQARSAALLSGNCPGFYEGAEPPVRALASITGPAIVAASWFAPGTGPITLEPAFRRLTHDGQTVAWIVGNGEHWEGPHDEGPAHQVAGVLLRGTFDLITAGEQLLPEDCAAFLAGDRDPAPGGGIVLGDPRDVVILGAEVEPGVVFDVRHGPVVLERGVETRHGTRLEGPLYAGPRCRLLGGYLRTSVFGPRCTVRGEVSGSTFLGYSNKSHDGFVGHSVVGYWVNLGAGTTTSNLKNTYGPITIQAGDARLETGRQFLGSLIADHVKTAIGTLLGTGTVVSVGAHLFGPAPVPKCVPPFAWGNEGRERLDEKGFLRIAERVWSRREIEFTPERRASLVATYRRFVSQ